MGFLQSLPHETVRLFWVIGNAAARIMLSSQDATLSGGGGGGGRGGGVVGNRIPQSSARGLRRP